MICILAEKPSAARNFAKALGGPRGNFNGEQFVIVPARGHLYEFVDVSSQVPAGQQAQYKSWDLACLPWDERAFSWQRALKQGAGSVLSDIKTAMKGCTEICIATDDDPTGEGELIAWEIFDALGIDGTRQKISRMYFADESAKEVQTAFVHRKPIASKAADMDYAKAQYRSQWDFLSMQFTRIATACGDGHSVLRQGRLKSAMVLLVGDQLKAVAGYKKIPFYVNKFKDENGVIYTSDKEPMYPNKSDVPQTYRSSGVTLDGETRKFTPPPRLIDLATLSAKLSARGLSAKTVLTTYQKLYDAQIVSYPRTKDEHITPGQFQDLLPHVDAIARLVGIDPKLLTHRQPRPTHVKNGCAHGANRPGLVVPKSLEELDRYGPGAQDIYVMLARNYLIMLGEDYEYQFQKGHVTDYPDFKGTAHVMLKPGWKQLLSVDDDVDDDIMNNSAQGLGQTASPFIHEGFPPKPAAPTMYWLMQQLDKRDVGTGATRTSIYVDVTNPQSKFPLLTEKRGKLSMTQYGDMSYRLLPGTYIGDLSLTEQVMADIANIAAGKADAQACLARVRDFVRHDIDVMQANGQKMRQELGISMNSKSTAGQKEKWTGTWKGKQVSFNRTWGGHRFTDAECDALCRGEEITVRGLTSKTGSTYGVIGKLTNQTYNGRAFVGFERIGFAQDIPHTMWQHDFSDEEIAALERGEYVHLDGAVSKDGRIFEADVKWGKRDDGSTGFIFKPRD